MGLWQKTMFYLGLVDEDAVGFDDGSGHPEEPPMARRVPQRQPTEVVRQAPTPQRATGAPQRTPGAASPAAPQRPLRTQVREPAPQDQWGSDVQPVAPPRGTEYDPYVGDGPTVIRATYPTVAGRRVEPPMAGRRRPMADRALTEAGVVVQHTDRPLVRTVSGADLESEVIVARSYNDAQVLADHIRANIPVVLDLRKVEPAMVRRLVDFSSGLTYALGGSMRKIGQGVVLVTPANVNLSRDERRRLKELGYYQAPEEG